MKLNKIFLAGLIALTFGSGIAHAEAISSQSIMQSQHSYYNKQQIIDMVNREDVQNQMITLGVNKPMP